MLPDGFHRIRHYGPLAGASRKAHVAKIRSLLGAEAPSEADAPSAESIPFTLREPCPDCGGPMRIVEIFRRGQQPRARAPPCPCGCGNMVRIGEDRTERLDQIPARYQVIVTIRPKYACPKGPTGVVQARAPAHLLEGSWPTEALLAQIAVSKHSEHMPLNRQAAVMARYGVPIDRSVLADWMGRTGAVVGPVVDHMAKRLMSESARLYFDETTPRCWIREAARRRLVISGPCYATTAVGTDLRRRASCSIIGLAPLARRWTGATQTQSRRDAGSRLSRRLCRARASYLASPRVEVVRAIVEQPRLLMDKPFAALDANYRSRSGSKSER